MYRIAPLDPIDYLIIGHVTQDITPNGPMIGGTASYASLTARALGMRVRIRDRKGKGKIVIEYSTLEDFDRVVEMLKGR